MTEMTEDAQQEAQLLRAEVARLQKIIKVLMDKAERSASLYDTDFNLFQTTITLEKQVQQRTAELEAALHENERVTRALRESESQVRQLAFYDALTSLANRRLLHDRLTEALLACKRHRHRGALLFLDLDHFKPLNDAHGHEAGDLLLVEAANRLKGCVRAMDTVARMGGDEFVVLIAPLAPELPVAEAQAMTVAEKIRAALALPYRLHLHGDDPASVVEHHCTSSIGVTLFDEHTLEDDALQRADEAMYRAKEEKGATGSVFRWLPMTESLFRAMADRIPGQSPFHSPLPSLLRLCNRANNDCKKSEPLLTSSQLQHDESELQSGGTGWSVVPVLNM